MVFVIFEYCATFLLTNISICHCPVAASPPYSSPPRGGHVPATMMCPSPLRPLSSVMEDRKVSAIRASLRRPLPEGSDHRSGLETTDHRLKPLDTERWRGAEVMRLGWCWDVSNRTACRESVEAQRGRTARTWCSVSCSVLSFLCAV